MNKNIVLVLLCIVMNTFLNASDQKIKKEIEKIHSAYIGISSDLDAGPCMSRFKNQVAISQQDEKYFQLDEQYPQLLAFTQQHIVRQQEKAKSPNREELIWRHDWIKKHKKLYAHCKSDQKILYQNLDKDVKRIICEFAYLEGPLVQPKNYTIPYCSELQFAVGMHMPDRVQILIALGVDVNAAEAINKETPLFMVINNHQYEDSRGENAMRSYAIFRYLLDRGADYNKQNGRTRFLCTEKDTPLFAAAKNEKAKFLLLDLLQLPNINLHIKNRFSATVLDDIKQRSMNQNYSLDRRKYYYRVCELLERVGAPSSVVLKSMPSDQQMNFEYGCAYSHEFISCCPH